jgi:hypothetical protein
MFKNGMRPVHPGEVLREDYLKPLSMSANALAATAERWSEIRGEIHGRLPPAGTITRSLKPATICTHHLLATAASISLRWSSNQSSML